MIQMLLKQKENGLKKAEIVVLLLEPKQLKETLIPLKKMVS